MKKQCTKPPVAPIQEGTPGASESELSSTNFLKEYIPPRKMTVKPVRLQKEAKYELVEPEIPPGVIVEEDMLGAVENMKFADHDLSDEKKFRVSTEEISEDNHFPRDIIYPG
jgi:hypothetical protein